MFSRKNENQRIVSYNLTETTLMFLKACCHYSFGTYAKLKIRDTKINIASLIHVQMTKFQKFWISEYFIYQCNLLIKIQPTGSTIIFTSKFFFRSIITLDDLRLAINSERNFSYLCSMSPCGQNYANLC